MSEIGDRKEAVRCSESYERLSFDCAMVRYVLLLKPHPSEVLVIPDRELSCVYLNADLKVSE